MIRRIANKNSFVGMVIADGSEEEESNPFCSTCMAMGELSKMKNRLYLDDNGKRLPDPPDADNWLMCWKCGNIIATRDAKMLGKISGISGITPVENPCDEKKGVILGTDSRLSSRIKKLKRRQTKHEDKEVQSLIEMGWELKSYSHSLPIDN